jgi:nitroimidazol reductase NimA-like FMN-containing flavoprotein (pyridoxamine 5'-phosphate oxidase superfamily)
MVTDSGEDIGPVEPVTSGPISSVVVPIFPKLGTDLLWAGAILSSWFEAPLEIVTDNAASAVELDRTAHGLGLNASQVTRCEAEHTDEEFINHLDVYDAAVVVLPCSEAGLTVARRTAHCGFLVDPAKPHRLPSGPLVVGLMLDRSDLPSLAVAAVWAVRLQVDIRLVSAGSLMSEELLELDGALHRLRSMGLNVTVEEADDVVQDGPEIAERVSATALVLPAVGLDRLVAESCGAPLLVPGCGHRVENARLYDSQPLESASLEVIDPAECMKLISLETLGRLGYIDLDRPNIVPVNYRSVDGNIFIRSLEGQKLESAHRRDATCLEVDRLDKWGRTGWSVVVHGTLEVIKDAAHLQQAWENDPQPWAHSETFTWLRMEPRSVTGRRVVR